mmetsp:Transcript_70121/g.164507  ORF Transcript_70121/g.164507 Transcript_70121/m.164507 type:complete len:221 (+) Transcript_70121:716-1378(+)
MPVCGGGHHEGLVRTNVGDRLRVELVQRLHFATPVSQHNDSTLGCANKDTDLFFSMRSQECRVAYAMALERNGCEMRLPRHRAKGDKTAGEVAILHPPVSYVLASAADELHLIEWGEPEAADVWAGRLGHQVQSAAFGATHVPDNHCLSALHILASQCQKVGCAIKCHALDRYEGRQGQHRCARQASPFARAPQPEQRRRQLERSLLLRTLDRCHPLPAV